jgi:hypothetical protein
MPDKALVYQLCLAAIETRYQAIVTAMSEVQQATLEDSKSSMGDKYETSRAMAHLELEKLSAQRLELEKQRHSLQQVQLAPHALVRTGSLVHTSAGYFFVCISSPALEVAGARIQPLSGQSPLGAKMMGLQKGDRFVWNGATIEVLDVH